MIKFFRKIRQRLLAENATNKPASPAGRYLLYAIGEIVLVVIGILLALQINNWNQKRISKNSMLNYYERIHEELISINPLLIDFSKVIDSLKLANSRSLYILNLRDRDSLDQLKYTIGALGTAYRTHVWFPVTEEFINEGNLSRIQNEAIKVEFQKFGRWMKRLNAMDDYIDRQYASSIEPFFYDKINYAGTVFSSWNRDGLVAGGPETDYSQFYNDMELWNLLTFKLETTNAHSRTVKRFTDYLKSLDSLIVKEIDASKK